MSIRPRLGSETRSLSAFGLGVLVAGVGLLSGSGRATELRLMGMGELNLVVEDEGLMVNLYDFGGNVAGLYLDEPMSTLTGVFSYGIMSISEPGDASEDPLEMSYFGDPMKQKIMSYLPAFHRMNLPARMPLGVDLVYRMESSAVGVKAEFARDEEEFVWWSVIPERSGVGTRTLAMFPSTVLEYNVLFADRVSLGVEAGYLRMAQSTDPGTNDLTVNSFGGGFGVGFFLSETATVGGKVDFVRPELHVGAEDTTVSGGGFGISMQGLYHLFGLFRAGANLRYRTVSGSPVLGTSDVTADIRSGNTSDLVFETKALTSFFLIPTQLGVSIGYTRESIDFEGVQTLEEGKQTEVGVFEGDIWTIPISVGVVYATPGVTAGGELHYTRGGETREETASPVGSSVLSFNLGTEVGFGWAAVRSGLVMSRSDPDRDVEHDGWTTKKFTVGLGLSAPSNKLQGDLAYNYVVRTFEEDPDVKTSTNLFAAGFRLLF